MESVRSPGIERFRAMTADEKVRLTQALSIKARDVMTAGVRARHPDWSEPEVAAREKRWGVTQAPSLIGLLVAPLTAAGPPRLLPRRNGTVAVLPRSGPTRRPESAAAGQRPANWTMITDTEGERPEDESRLIAKWAVPSERQVMESPARSPGAQRNPSAESE